MVDVQDLGALFEQRSFGQPSGPARVHEDDGVIFLRLGGHDRLSRGDQVLIGDGGVAHSYEVVC